MFLGLQNSSFGIIMVYLSSFSCTFSDSTFYSVMGDNGSGCGMLFWEEMENTDQCCIVHRSKTFKA